MSNNEENILTFYTPEAEVWDAKKCERMAKRIHKDGMGCSYPYKGHVESSSASYGYGERRYNGGTVQEGKWYHGTNVPWPILAEGFEFQYVPTWGTRIVKISKTDKQATKV